MKLVNRIFSIQHEVQFKEVALAVYQYQLEHCAIYKAYVDQLDWPEPTQLNEIPFLPISFFKTHRIADRDREVEVVFKSSGTGGHRSSHFVTNTDIYERSFNSIYEHQIGYPENQVILALLPNYIEQGESSLVYMVDHLIQKTKNDLSGFFLANYDALIKHYNQAIEQGKQVIIFGVSYALLDICEIGAEFSKATIIETGGMKGRRKEMTKAELHAALRIGLNCEIISSEYGMTELLSQAYSTRNGRFKNCKWMNILIRDVNDPFSYVENGRTGGINVIDLANINSCSFIATQDLGRIIDTEFEIIGRYDNSDIRGCNLLVQ